ncbi:MAG: hypothetical protein HGA25_11700, partial [Clostridiales bacterium]|nr:hypothetical protein [Clostridiales bacterium]
MKLTIEYDLEAYSETNGYYGTYLNLYLAEFTENLQWYLDSLDYAEGWTWFDANGSALSNEAVAAMTTEDKVNAFIEGRYTKSSTMGEMGGAPGGGPTGEAPTGEFPEGDITTATDGEQTEGNNNEMVVGTPDSGTTQSADSTSNSSTYETYEDMVASYKADIEEIQAGDEYGNNLVSLYNPLEYIGAEGSENSTWTKIVMGAAEGDMSMFASLNLQIAWLNAGVDSEIEWQWDGGHVPSETLGNSFALYVDQMYAINDTTANLENNPDYQKGLEVMTTVQQKMFEYGKLVNFIFIP